MSRRPAAAPPPPRPAHHAGRLSVAKSPSEDDARGRRTPTAAPTLRHRIYINETWFILIDESGYLADSQWAEGALGCVLQLHAEQGGNKMALKIPRLLADTIRENAFIAQMLENEEEIVHLANVDAAQPSGLLRVQLAHRNPLRGLRQLANQGEAVREHQHEGALFVSFEKGRPPRFCSARRRDGEIVLHPERVAEALGPALQLHWDTLHRTSARPGQGRPFQRTVFVRSGDGSPTIPAGALEERIESSSNGGTWYAALPSIVFDWARGTLQEAVSRGDNVLPPTAQGRPTARPWGIREHYGMLLCILRGLDGLHARGIIHGDIRPANVMCMGDLGTPESYVLGDYGGTLLGRASVEDHRSTSGHTAMGPSVGNHRTSVFYALERRSGIERETADTAVILHEVADGEGEYFIVLGWKSDLLDEQGRLREEVRDDLHDRWSALRQRGEPAYADERLRGGDRLRLRDFVFTVIDSELAEDGRSLFRCRTRFAHVVHDRLAVVDRSQGIDDGMVLSLARSIELRKWSAATDVYGVGVVALWSIFMSSPENRRCPDGASAGEVTRSIETRLHELVEHLASVTAFYDLWPLVSRCARVLLAIDPCLPSEQIARTPAPGGETLLFKAVEEVVHVLSCLHHGRELLRCFDYNGAHFILFVHFLMACIHRRVYGAESNSAAEPVDADCLDCALPFALHRHDPPRPGGPAARALRHLQGLLHRLDMPAFSAFVFHPGADAEHPTDEIHQTSSALIVHRLREAEKKTQQVTAHYQREWTRAEKGERRLAELVSFAEAVAESGWDLFARQAAVKRLVEALRGGPSEAL
ncbi:MAG: serine/threonine-protein kinase [Nannocystaceae bacterium]